jgi:hypothetical protein
MAEPEIVHVFDGKGRHYIEVHDPNGTLVAKSDLCGYQMPAVAEWKGRTFVGTTDYYDGVLPRVFEIRPVTRTYDRQE